MPAVDKDKSIVILGGIRSQYMKLAALQRATARSASNFLFVDTGQHYDSTLAGQYLDEYQLHFDRRLDCGSALARPGAVLGGMIDSLDHLFANELEPAGVVVFGDANTTLAGAIAAGRLALPLAHVEAGVRTGADTPEEFNRVVADHVASLHLASCRRDLANLVDEGRGSTSYLVGDLVRDLCADHASKRDEIDEHLVVVSLHRAEHTQSGWLIDRVMRAAVQSGFRVTFLAHPRVEEMARSAAQELPGVEVVASVRHNDLLDLLARARVLITDSGALQRECYYVGCRAVVVQERPFWPSLVEAGFNVAVDPDGDIQGALDAALLPADAIDFNDFGEGPVAPKVVEHLERWIRDF